MYVGSCFTAVMADAAEKLRLIHPAAAGTDKVDFDALAGGVIAAAAIDVWYRYPSDGGVSAPSDLPFAELPNLLMTPHSSGVTRDTFTGRVDDIAANIGRLHEGEPLENLVTGGR